MLFRLITAIEGLKSRLRNVYYRMLGVRLHGYVWMRRIEIPRNYNDVAIEADVSLDRGVVLLCSGPKHSTGEPKLKIGSRTYINRSTMIDAVDSIVIGEDCAIGPGCYLTDHDHGQNPTLPPLAQPMIASPTRLGNRVWLGAKVIVLKGVTIGDGAIIGAGSVVTKSIPPNSVAIGVPARVVNYTETISAPVVSDAQ